MLVDRPRDLCVVVHAASIYRSFNKNIVQNNATTTEPRISREQFKSSSYAGFRLSKLSSKADLTNENSTCTCIEIAKHTDFGFRMVSTGGTSARQKTICIYMVSVEERETDRGWYMVTSTYGGRGASLNSSYTCIMTRANAQRIIPVGRNLYSHRDFYSGVQANERNSSLIEV